MTLDLRRNARFFYARWKLPLNTLALLTALGCAWLYRRSSLISATLERAHLAPIPRDADSTYVSRRVGFTITDTEVGFRAPPDVVRAWWDASPGTRGAQTSTLRIVDGQPTRIPARPVTVIPPDRFTVFQRNDIDADASLLCTVDRTRAPRHHHELPGRRRAPLDP
jgi:hypothetical protein